MRKLFFIAGLLFFGNGLYGQLSLNKSFNYSTNITKINSTTYKYYLMDVPSAQCRIYNLDFSLYKTVNLPVPGGELLYDVRFVSEDLFNDDAKIEVLYTYYAWIPAYGTVPEHNVYHTKVINEDGTVLLDVEKALYSYVNETSENEYSLFLYAYDFSVDPYLIWTNIYKLPGVVNVINEAKKSAFSIDSYPNPTNSFVNIDYTLPQGVLLADLHILNSSGKEHGVYQVDGFTNHLRLETDDFLPGIYYYFLESAGEKSETLKIIIQ